MVTITPYTSLSTGGTLVAYPTSLKHIDQALLEDLRPWNPIYHEEAIHNPIRLDNYDEAEYLDKAYVSCIDMPLRLPGQNLYQIPEEWASLAPLLQEIINIEHNHNPNVLDYYPYLTVRYQGNLALGQVQSNPGAHTDGFQSSRHNPKVKTSRNYILSTNGETIYYPQTFTMGLDMAKYNIFAGLDLQINKDKEHNPIQEVTEENYLYYLDSYVVHAGGATLKPGNRIFLRLTFDLFQFDRAGNTHNSMLDYRFEPHAIDIRDSLIIPTRKQVDEARLLPKKIL